MRRVANPLLSSSGETALARYHPILWEHEDLTDASRRNSLSDLRHFAAGYETGPVQCANETASLQTEFGPQPITTPILIRYRAYLQKELCQKPNSVHRALISVKCYCGWTIQKRPISYGPSAPVKRIGEEKLAPRHLEDKEEQALVAAVINEGNPRDRVLIVLLLRMGPRTRAICQLRQDQVKPGKRNGTLEVPDKRNKHCEVPLNATARKALVKHVSALPSASTFLFPSGKTNEALSERAPGYSVKRYADRARFADVSPHDLRHRFDYRMAAAVPLYWLAQIMDHDSLNRTGLYI